MIALCLNHRLPSEKILETKSLYPTTDWNACRVMTLLDIPSDRQSLVVAFARMAGWLLMRWNKTALGVAPASSALCRSSECRAVDGRRFRRRLIPARCHKPERGRFARCHEPERGRLARILTYSGKPGPAALRGSAHRWFTGLLREILIDEETGLTIVWQCS